MTLGDLYPRLRQLPGYEAHAGRPAPGWPAIHSRYGLLPAPAEAEAARRPLDLPATIRPPGLARELVVARHREDIAWLRDSPIAATVYLKSDSPVPGGLPDGVRLVELPNVGREAHTYLHHIVEHYGDLAGWTYFVQGDPHCPVGELWRRIAVDYADTASLTREYSPTFPADAVKARDRAERHGGFEVRYGLVDPTTPGYCDAADMPARDLWAAHFAGPMPEPWHFAYAAQLAVPRRRITARPLAHWRHLLAQVSGENHREARGPFSPWAFEMVWMHLFGDAPIRTPDGPGLWRMARNLGGSIARHVADGMEAAAPEVQAERKATCYACEPFHDHGRDRCRSCGCVAMGRKRSWASEACPEGKWGPV